MVDKKEIADRTHIIDEVGEVIIILQNSNAPFAIWSDTEQHNMPSSSQETETKSEKDGDEHRIQVSAKHLMFASPVFKKTLTGGWKESYTFVMNGSVEIRMDSWDIDALLIFLKIIHCRHHEVPCVLDLEILAKVIVLADYYGCLEVLKVFKDMWVSYLRLKFPTSYCRDLLLWLWISWSFRLDDFFQEATLIAMTQSNGWVTNLGLPISDKILDTINDRRQSAIRSLIDSLHGRKDGLFDSDGCFECISTSLGTLMTEMHLNGLLCPKPAAPFPGIRLCELEKKVRSFRAPVDCAYHNTKKLLSNLLPERPYNTERGLKLAKFDNGLVMKKGTVSYRVE